MKKNNHKRMPKVLLWFINFIALASVLGFAGLQVTSCACGSGNNANLVELREDVTNTTLTNKSEYPSDNSVVVEIQIVNPKLQVNEVNFARNYDSGMKITSKPNSKRYSPNESIIVSWMYILGTIIEPTLNGIIYPSDYTITSELIRSTIVNMYSNPYTSLANEISVTTPTTIGTDTYRYWTATISDYATAPTFTGIAQVTVKQELP